MTINWKVFEGDDGKLVFVKYMQFLRQQKVDVIKDEIIQGTMCSPDWVPDRFGTTKTLKHLLEGLPGHGYCYWSWEQERRRPGVVAAEPEVEERQRKIRIAVQFLKDEAPRGDFDCEETTWLECQLVDPHNPLQNIRKEVIYKVLQKIKDKDHVATKQYYFLLLLSDVRPEYLDIVKRMAPLLTTTTALSIGEAGFGKNPLMTILGFAMARWHADIQSRQGRDV
jgi:hypothetical protein